MGSVIAALLREAYLRLSHQSKSASRAGSGEDLVGRWSGCRWRPPHCSPRTRVVEFPQNVTPDAQERPTRRAEWQLASVFEGCSHFSQIRMLPLGMTSPYGLHLQLFPYPCRAADRCG